MVRRLGRAAIMAACLFVSFFASAPPAAAHPLHLMISNPNFVNPEPVDSTQRIAQSIVPSVGFVVTRVSLRVADPGSNDTLTVDLHDDSAGAPGSTILASGTGDGDSAPIWLDVDVTPNVLLAAGQTYWIVARSLTPTGYNWYDTNNDTAYLPGTGVTSADGIAWFAAGKDFAFRVYGFRQPLFSFSASAANSTADAGRTVTFRANFTNAGSDTSAGVWVNVTLPSGLTYVTDDADSIGGIRSGPPETPTFAFANVAPGAYSFTLTAQVASGVANGTILPTPFSFEGADHNGAPLSSANPSVPVTVRNTLGGVGPGEGSWWWLLILAVAIVPLVVFVVWTRGKLEEVFLVSYSWILLAHLSNTMKAERDRDLLTGMLTAVQDFIRDSFATTDEGELKRMDFGERTIHIQRGSHSYLAAVVRGRPPFRLEQKMVETLGKLEKAFPESLVQTRVDGKVLDGAGELLSKELLRR